jgi:prepilin-type N-terminal cleavage/methylation domain-containing protein
MNKAPFTKGFSLVELVVAVAVIGLLAAMGFSVFSRYKAPIAEVKLGKDVATLNSAVKVYLASGGSLDSVTDLEAVLAKLKTRIASSQIETVSGPKGAFIDRRAKAVMQTTAEAATSEPRLVWVPAQLRFSVATSGTGGAKEIALDDAITGAPTEETRDVKLKLATEDKWIWDYTDATLPSRPSYSEVPVATIIPTSPTTSGGAKSGILIAPSFSILGGTYPLSNYDLTLTLSDTNPSGLAYVMYSLDGGTNWEIYSSGALPITPGSTVSAYCAATDPDEWIDSSLITETYLTTPVELDLDFTVPSLAVNYAEVGGSMIPGSSPSPAPSAPGAVTLANASQVPASYQNDSVFTVHWTYDGSDPVSSGTRQTTAAFLGGFPGQLIDYSLPWWGSGTVLPIQAVAESRNTSLVTTSPVTTKVLGVSLISLRSPVITLAGTDVIIDLDYYFGDTPAGARIYYTVDGTDPGDLSGVPTSGTLYAGPFSISSVGGNDIKARVFAPDTFEQWFVASDVTTETPSVAVIIFTMTVSTSTP